MSMHKTYWGMVCVTLGFAASAMAIETPEYEVLQSDGAFEVRQYKPYLVAETVVEGDVEDAGNKAFRILFNYISGENESRRKVEMTAPVEQRVQSEKIKMTAPVEQQRRGEVWVVSFVMPGAFTLETLPQPTNDKVSIRQVPSRRIAAVRYSGSWSGERYHNRKKALEAWMSEKEIRAAGASVWARYNSPFSFPFLRRNEVLIPVEH